MAADLGDVDDLGALEDAEVDGLVGPLVEVLEERRRHLQQAPFDRRAHAELEEPAAEPVARLLALEQPQRHQVAGEPVHVDLASPVRSRSSASVRWASSAVNAKSTAAALPSTVPGPGALGAPVMTLVTPPT